MVPASHTSSAMNEAGEVEAAGVPPGYIIAFENRQKVYVSGDTGLTSDMKLVVADFFKPDISILPACGLFVMEPDQAVYTANVVGSRYVIPSHDFPKEMSDATDREASREFVAQFPVLESCKKVERFADIMRTNYPHIETIYLSIGGRWSLDETCGSEFR